MAHWSSSIMTNTSETAVFFGSGPVAANSLRLLIKHTKIEAVVTKPRPAGYNGSVPVISTAEDLSLPIYYADNKRTLDDLIATKPFRSRIGVLVDFGIIVSQAVISYFPRGIVNSHFSLLPEWRGADPITFAVLSGQKQTGVSLMLLVAAMDEGPLLGQALCRLSDTVTTPELTDMLVQLSDDLLRRKLSAYLRGDIEAQPQDGTRAATYSRRLTKADGLMNWHKSAQQLEREVRAYLGWPKSIAKLANKDIVITKAAVCDEHGTPGSVIVRDKHIIVCCGDKSLDLVRLKPAGKREMTAEAFLAGNRQRL